VELAGDTSLRIEVAAEGCTLLRPREAGEALRELHERPLPAMQFLRRLRHHGDDEPAGPVFDRNTRSLPPVAAIAVSASSFDRCSTGV
jgi:hypothetical protein